MWKYTGQQRPDFADTPGDGQESVWDYPRPPALVACTQLVEVRTADRKNKSPMGITRAERIFDAGDDLHRPAALFTGLDVAENRRRVVSQGE